MLRVWIMHTFREVSSLPPSVELSMRAINPTSVETNWMYDVYSQNAWSTISINNCLFPPSIFALSARYLFRAFCSSSGELLDDSEGYGRRCMPPMWSTGIAMRNKRLASNLNFKFKKWRENAWRDGCVNDIVVVCVAGVCRIEYEWQENGGRSLQHTWPDHGRGNLKRLRTCGVEDCTCFEGP